MDANTDHETSVKHIRSGPPTITSDFLPITSTLGITSITGDIGYTPKDSEPLFTITSAAGSVAKTTSFYLTTTTNSETTLVSRKSTITLSVGTACNSDVKVACCHSIKDALIYTPCKSWSCVAECRHN
ncbi:hypothetical protein EJ03DRAFT_322829 [Teratosphaeria nubilosa]|uniref:Uncharacterized protein n=1 Tax=Teratosphaeria nubilosa TaxID=161662 RepID=A0A6G1LMV4_9PEZI|nr:hypothetical protein EJ03DRAFT_322829 [Teratosphaeria nubilosa]